MTNAVLRLPQPSPEDDMREKKESLLEERGLPLEFRVSSFERSDGCSWLDSILASARILQLTETEWYFLEEDDEGPFSPRNEIEALHVVESLLRQLKNVSQGSVAAVQKGHALVVDRLNSFGESGGTGQLVSKCSGEPEKAMLGWAAEQGVKSSIEIAVFEGTGRGAEAAVDLEPGDIVLDIPQEVMICEDVVLQSDMGRVLSEVGVSGETMAMLWTMRERHNKDSKFAAYFAFLPQTFNTGLSFGVRGLQALQGTLLLGEILAAKEHLRQQYDVLVPALTLQHPELFPEDQFGWEHYLWACELWYSYGIKVLFPDGHLKTCLIPMASLLNHSLYPHITHYSKINPGTRSLQLQAVRSCKAGAQCFLSYGPLSNQDLLLFYGFIIKDNPYDTIPIEFDTAPQCPSVDSYDLGHSHMVRATWLGKRSRELGLPTRLLASLRILCLNEDDSNSFQGNPRHPMVEAGVETAALESLLSTLDYLLEGLEEPSSGSPTPCREAADGSADEDWDVALAAEFVRSQWRLIESVRRSCMQLIARWEEAKTGMSRL